MMDVASLVKNITSAFEDAATLVTRIRKKREGESDVQLAPIDDLLDSLSLGPTVVKGYYESDAKRFGSLYMTGDSIAREQLKDALINLQMTVLSNLGSVILDDKDPDYDAIQAASDDCRVNVGVCLGQLSQRMSRATRGYSATGRTQAYDNGQLRPMQRSDTLSTHSSARSRFTPMTPPESDVDYLNEIGLSVPQWRQKVGRAPDIDVMDGMHSASYSGLYTPSPDGSTTVPVMNPRSASVPPPRGMESPTIHYDLPYRARESSISTETSSSRGNPLSIYQTHTSQEMLVGMSDTQSEAQTPGYFPPQPTDHARSNSYGELTFATLGKSRSSLTLAQVGRKPLSPTQSIHSIPSSLRPAIPEENEKEVYIAPSAPANAPVNVSVNNPYRSPISSPIHSPVSFPVNPPRDPPPAPVYNPPSYTPIHTPVPDRPVVQPPSIPNAMSVASVSTPVLAPVPDRPIAQPVSSPTAMSIASSNAPIVVPAPERSFTQPLPNQRTVSVASGTTIQRVASGPLTLPTEKNLLGYCKGAFRLQSGMEKKAFGLSNRPLGYASMIQFWKCDKCQFEGQCSSVIPPGAKKAEKMFDPVIRDHVGIRYKWAFLAKCHVPLKSTPEGRRDGLYGSFACIFCTAEAAQRGWPTPPNALAPERASIKSSNSGPSTGSMVFGNIHGFMDHLQMHRQEEFWPGVEMQGRMKCIVGRIAQRGEEFDINLPPPE